MRDPWRHVDADDDGIADFLAGTVAAVADLGGWLHPSLRFVVRDGHAHAESAAPAGEPLLRVPSDAFVPLARIAWASGPDALGYEVPDGALTGAQLELLMLQAAFHDACGKLPWLASAHPALGELDASVVDAVRAFRPGFRRAFPEPASLLWSTRAFRVALGAAADEPVAVPLLDLLDHRRGGATPAWTGSAFEVASAGPGPAWLDYGLERDAIGMAVVYGFADSSGAIAHASPMTVEADGRHAVVEARGRLRDGTLLDPIVREADGVARISHLAFRPGNGDALAASIGSRAIVDAVASVDEARCLAVIDACAAAPSAAATVLADAAAVQLRVLAAR